MKLQDKLDFSIELVVNFRDSNHEVSANTTRSTIQLQIPVMASKQVVFPKVFDGAIESLLGQLWTAVNAERARLEDEKEIEAGRKMF